MNSITGVTKDQFVDTRWGSLRKLQFPSSLLMTGACDLSAPALLTYFVFLFLHRRKMRIQSPAKRRLETLASVRTSRKALTRLTGYSNRTLDKAVKELESSRLIEVERHRRRDPSTGILTSGAEANRYFLNNPEKIDRSPMEVNGEISVIHANGLRYFTAPEVLVSDYKKPWALANLSSGELRVYVTSLWLGSRNRANTFNASTATLRTVARITDRRTFEKTLAGLELLGLVKTEKLKSLTRNSRDVKITLCDPTTGEPVVNPTEDATQNPANYLVEGAKGSKRFILNQGSAEDREKLLLSFLPPDAKTVKQSNGEISIQCPFHNDSTPSCSVNVSKRVFHCFGCLRGGTLMELFTQLKHGNVEATMEAIAASRDEKVTFRDPDANAEAIYSYRDDKGTLVKQVLRYAEADGEKVIRQRRLGKAGGWVWNVNGIGPCLYNRDLLKESNIVCLTEGEKDADTVTGLELRSHHRPIIGVTSGGSDSWDDSLADHLFGKHVVVMPDADEAGERYRDAVIGSLVKRGIRYRVASFEGAGCKDVSQYAETHTAHEVAELIGTDWATAPMDVPDVEIKL